MQFEIHYVVNMTTPSNTNGNVDGDEDRGNWSQLGEMIGYSVYPTTTATTSSLPTANTNADNATTTKSTTNGDTFPTVASSAWRPSVLVPAPPDSPQMSIITALNSGASLTVDSSSGKRKDDSTPQVCITTLSTSPFLCSLLANVANPRVSLH